MLYRLSTYQSSPARLDALRAEREEGAWQRLERAGAMPLGLWRVMLGGRPGEVIELVRFDSLVRWQAAAADDWSEFAPESEIGMRPVSRRHPGGEPLPVAPGNVWALRTMLPAPGTVGRVVELTEDQLWPGFWSESQGEERLFTLGLFIAHVAERQQLVMLTYYAELADWEDSRDAGRLAHQDESGRRSAAAIRERSSLLERGGVRLLTPLSRRAPKRGTCTEEGGGR